MVSFWGVLFHDGIGTYGFISYQYQMAWFQP